MANYNSAHKGIEIDNAVARVQQRADIWDAGTEGPPGKSAFAYATEGGYTGNESQFYADLGAVGGLAAAILSIVGGG